MSEGLQELSARTGLHRRSHRAFSADLPALAVLSLLVWTVAIGVASPALARDKRPPPPTTTTTAPATIDAVESSSSAAPAAPLVAPPADAPMRAHYDYARAMFAQKDFVAAAQAMERAYAKEPKPMLLFNVGQAYRKAARYAEAMDAYKRFLQIAPQHPMAPDARDYIHTIEILNTQEDKRKEIELAMEQTQQEMERMRRPPVYKRAWFWATIIGGAAAVVAIGVGAKVYQDQRATDSGLLMVQF